MDKIFSKKLYEENGIIVSEQMIKITIKYLIGDTIKEDIDFQHEFKTESWSETACDDEVEKNPKKLIIWSKLKLMKE